MLPELSMAGIADSEVTVTVQENNREKYLK